MPKIVNNITSLRGLGKEGTTDFVAFETINKLKLSSQVRNTLGSKTRDGSDLTDEAIADYVREQRFQKEQVVAAKKKTKRHDAVGGKITPQKIYQRMQEYDKWFDLNTLTPNDRTSLEQLIRCEETIRIIDTELDELRGCTDKDSHETYGKLVTEKNNNIKNINDLQKILGIDRVGRTSAKTKVNPEEEIKEMVLAAQSFIEEQLVTINCPQCHTHHTWVYNLLRNDLSWAYIHECGCGLKCLVMKDLEQPFILTEDSFQEVLACIQKTIE